MRCVFRVAPAGTEWIEDLDAAPEVTTKVRHDNAQYTVEQVEWWFGGVRDDITSSSDVLVTLRPARQWARSR
jgi:hypothetical protein